MNDTLKNLRIIVRGAGEMATGTAWRLHRSGFTKLLLTDIAAPLAVRRPVSFCEAIWEGSWEVEGIRAVRIARPEEALQLWDQGIVPVIVDPENLSRNVIKPHVIVDAILAKVNLGTSIIDAELVVALGPGFCAGRDAHCVVETNRGHNLGRLILDGTAAPNTGTPGDIAGQTITRVLRAPRDGVFHAEVGIGAQVRLGQVVGSVSDAPVTAGLDGVLRGLIRPGISVTRGLKIGDVDPRGDVSYCYTISEKARAIGGAVLEAIMMTFNNNR
ncbi:MAG: EF2563 family selenium-dependent molybdenum hydroxylase system protein [Desulfomonile sp.]|nr:EF2563 family selenium-dependent molybdenum hydroxylase system protein [Desulfomonile sp.]